IRLQRESLFFAAQMPPKIAPRRHNRALSPIFDKLTSFYVGRYNRSIENRKGTATSMKRLLAFLLVVVVSFGVMAWTTPGLLDKTKLGLNLKGGFEIL